ncbi:MAG: AAA family ATPase [Myxococcales bacterium]|nr:AAA family ATPase [Myxococcales bacterium]
MRGAPDERSGRVHDGGSRVVDGDDGELGEAPFGERFRVIRCLGARGMGVVFEVYDRDRAERVALKTSKRLDALGLALFKNEFRALADIDHPHLVRLYELFAPLHAESDQWFFTMELIDGPTLMSWLRGGEDPALAETAEMSVEEALRPASPDTSGPPMPLPGASHDRLRLAMGQLAQGIAALHARGLLHRDIKPDNIRVDHVDGPDGEERVVLLDFGLAVRLDGTAGEGLEGGWVVGTRGYMSPQQAAGLPPTKADDWYAFGAVLYEALTGVAPRRGVGDRPVPITVEAPLDLADLAVALLDPDPAARPSEAEILHRLDADGRDERPRVALVGRRPVMAALDEALDRARGGSLTFAHLWGPSGMGKSFAVEAWLGERAPGTLVLRGRSHRREDVPFGPFDSLVDDLARRLTDWPRTHIDAVLPRHLGALVAVFPVLDRLAAVRDAPARQRVDDDPRLRRDRAATALREMLGRIADRRRVVLFLDDVQHGGPDSAALLDALFSPPDPPGVLLVSTARHTDGSPLIEALRAACEATGVPWAERCVPIGPLSTDESRLLAERLLEEGSSGERVARIADEAGGHPFLITELAAHTRLRLDRSKGFKLGDAIQARVADLPREARMVLELVALAERPLPTRLVIAASGGDADQTRALAALRAASLVRGGLDIAGTVEAFHDAVKDAVAEKIEPQRRAALHRALAEALEEEDGADEEQLALHWQGAGEAARAARWAVAGGRRAVAAGAFERGAAFYRQAIAGGIDDPEIHRALAEALQYAGRADEAAEAWMVTAARVSASARTAAERTAAEQWLMGGRVERAQSVLDRLIRAAGLRLPQSRLRAVGTIAWAVLGWWIRGLTGRLTPAVEPDAARIERYDLLAARLAGWYAMTPIELLWTVARAARVGFASGERGRAATALAMGRTLVIWSGLPGSRAAAERLGQACEAARGDALAVQITIEVMRVVTAMRRGDWRAVVDRIRRLEPVLHEAPAYNGWEPLAYRALYCFSAGLDGRYHELRARLPELMGDARRRGARIEQALVALFGGVTAHLAAGDPDAAEQALEDFFDRWTGPEASPFDVLATMARLRIMRYRGDRLGAFDAIGVVRRRWSESRVDIRDSLWLEEGLAALPVLDVVPEARGLVRQAARMLRRSSWGAGEAFSRVLEASLAYADGHAKRAVRELDTARRAFPLGEPPPRMAPLFDRARAKWSDDAEALATADAALRAQGVVDPERWMQALFPLPPAVELARLPPRGAS